MKDSDKIARKIIIWIGVIALILWIILWVSVDAVWFGVISGVLMFLFYLLIGLSEDGSEPSGGHSRTNCRPRDNSFTEDRMWGGDMEPDDYNPMTDSYYGMHGEFDRNDESRAISEDMQSFHRAYPETDLHEQYYWDEILDAATDGYLDDED